MKFLRILLAIVCLVFGYFSPLSLGSESFLSVYGPFFRYFILFLGIFFLLGQIKFLRPIFHALLALFVLAIVVETSSAVAFRVVHGDWHLKDTEQHLNLFDPHPFLVGVPRPGARATKPNWTWSAGHNSLGFRGDEFALEKKPGVTRIVTIGGSTTWGTSVNDHETWPYQLQTILGPQYEVINYGVPGYSTAEHIIQTALNLTDLKPDKVIYYIGWNDMVNVHIRGITTDYATYHGVSQYKNLDLIYSRIWIGPDFAVIRQLLSLAQDHGYLAPVFNPEIKIEGDINGGTDQRVLSIFERNVSLLIALCRDQNIEPILVPQLLNYEILTKEVAHPWTPYIKEVDMKRVMGEFTEVMKSVAQRKQVRFVGEILDHNWPATDFGDQGHFTALGGKKFAEILAPAVR